MDKDKGWRDLYLLCGWAICKLTHKHLRGKRIGLATSKNGKPLAEYRCSRCEGTWKRQLRSKHEPTVD